VKLNDLLEPLNLTLHTHAERVDTEVTGGYTGDLLSDVIANSRPGNLWATVQVHPNIVAVAVLKDLSAVVLVNGREPQAETVARADEAGVVLATTPLTGFELAGKVYERGALRV
jgi:hypothetical protein